jgi:hypothetical protein
MKKQKKPIILVLLLAVLFGGVAFMNRTPSKPGEEQAASAAAQAQDSSAEVAKDVQSQVSSKPQATPKPLQKHGGGPPGMPSLFKPDRANAKPQPSASATAGQWYEPEANKK